MMLHAGQQSAFPKVKFITNRMKIERLIREGLEATTTTVSAPLVDRRPESEYMTTMDDVVRDKNLPVQAPPPPRRPQIRKRRSSVIEEMRRQSAVFFDDTDDGEGYGDSTASEDGSAIAEETGWAKVD